MVGINIWDRSMDEAELRLETSCESNSGEQGNIANEFTNWGLSGSLLQKISVPEEDVLCTPKQSIINAFLPIPELTKQDALDLCSRFGRDVSIAGNIQIQIFYGPNRGT